MEERRAPGGAEPTVETVVTAGDGQYTYRVLAYRRLHREECRKVVWRALRVGYLQEPPPGGEAVLVTRIGHREGDEQVG